MHLVFSTIEQAIAANLQIFENYARSKSEVIRTATDDVVNPSTIDQGELVAMVYVVGGYKQGELQVSEGHTTSWARINERADQAGTFFFSKPDDSLMTDVVFDTQEEPTAGWYQNEAI